MRKTTNRTAAGGSPCNLAAEDISSALSPALDSLRRRLVTLVAHQDALDNASRELETTRAQMEQELAKSAWLLTSAQPGQIPELSSSKLKKLENLSLLLAYKEAPAEGRFFIGKKQIPAYGNVTYLYPARDAIPPVTFQIELSDTHGKITVVAPGECGAMSCTAFVEEFKNYFGYAQITVGEEHSNLKIKRKLSYVCNCDASWGNQFEFHCVREKSMPLAEKFTFIQEMLRGFFEAKGFALKDVSLSALSEQKISELTQRETQQLARFEHLERNAPKAAIPAGAARQPGPFLALLNNLNEIKDRLAAAQTKYGGFLEIDLLLGAVDRFPVLESARGGLEDIAVLLRGLRTLTPADPLERLTRKLGCLEIALEELAADNKKQTR